MTIVICPLSCHPGNPEVITELQGQNILQGAQDDPEMRFLFEQLDEIRVEKGKLIVVPKAAVERDSPAREESVRDAGDARGAAGSAQ